MKISRTIKNIMLAILLTLCTQYLYSNDNIRIEIQSGTMGYFGSVHDDSYNYSEKWELGAGIAYNVSPYVELCGIFSYHQFEFKGFSDMVVETSYSLDIDSQPTHLYETSIGVRIMTSKEHTIHPYFSLRTGFDIINRGEMIYKYTYHKDSTTSQSKSSGQKFVNTFIGLGAGLNIPFSSSIKLKVELYFTSGSKETYTGFMGSFQFSI